MTDLIVAPIVLPAAVAAFLVLALRHDLVAQRIVSSAATLALLALAIWLYASAADSAPQPYLLGDWRAPFGIVLVLDRLAATMLLLTALLAALVLIYAMAGWDKAGRHFHPLFQFQLMGLNGAFLTGDVFNLFVFFEVMLIASYGLMLHGGGPRRLRAGFNYVAINLIGSTLFLFAVGLIYAVTGTLNMADLAGKVAQIAPGDEALLRVGALLLLLVFALKAALVPLQWWLPSAYAAAAAPVAALFMMMTKVGAYSIVRVYTIVFGANAGSVADIAMPWVVPAALATLLLGAVGVLASASLTGLVCFAIVWSMGSLLLALGLFDQAGLAAGLYYLLHSTLSGAALFLLADLVIAQRAGPADRLVPAPPLPHANLLAGLFFAAAIAITGMPPLSGFLGKLLILDAVWRSPLAVTSWCVVLGTSLIVIIGFARAGSTLFWKVAPKPSEATTSPAPRIALQATVISALLGATVLLALFAGPVTRDLAATARQALDVTAYVRAVDPASWTALTQGGAR
ncbi:monovalent cation/H+ antiporter subunit D [Rhodopseudomonas sp. HC1]|uniref:monovalent cation/H+ antiporter subunit D n=1 Tax=Rhodopseudomonas infernalis TaxID=2897386 RepID=UPI001EE8F16F|nr:monovalent cation/H+ antiporter subunit D [Rhodopseudomonas infernalis]MCG6204645.1 monovalent cation/H+ antiporter subunit D [Rhodopseudomonas infernalis]